MPRSFYTSDIRRRHCSNRSSRSAPIWSHKRRTVCKTIWLAALSSPEIAANAPGHGLHQHSRTAYPDSRWQMVTALKRQGNGHVQPGQPHRLDRGLTHQTRRFGNIRRRGTTAVSGDSYGHGQQQNPCSSRLGGSLGTKASMMALLPCINVMRTRHHFTQQDDRKRRKRMKESEEWCW